MEIKVVIPSYRRAGNVKTIKVVSPCIICVPESELQSYKECYPNIEIVPHPDSIIGLALKRQWIYDHFGDIFMLDDDISMARRLWPMSGTKKATELTPDEAYAAIQWCGNTARLCGCYLFGFNKVPNPIIYDPFRPIMLSGYVTGCAIGLLRGSRITYSAESIAVEDFYVAGLNAYYHRKAFLDLRFNFVQEETFKRAGGLGFYRTIDTEKNDTLFLRRLFGEAITIKGESYGSHKGRTATKNHNPYGRTMHIPF
jgi:hypothetical protein